MSAATRGRAARTASALLLGTTALLVALSSGTTAAMAADPEPGVDLSVEVLPTGGDSAPVAGGPGGGTGSGVGGSGSGTGGTADATVVDPPAEPASSTSRGALFSVSGLSSVYSWSPNPGGGSVTARVTVSNGSTSSLDARAEFWMTTVTGSQIGSRSTVDISDLGAGTAQDASARLDGVGQWGLVVVHARVVPPATIDDTTAKALTRETFLLVPPWLVLGVIGLGAAGIALLRVLIPARLGAPLAEATA